MSHNQEEDTSGESATGHDCVPPLVPLNKKSLKPTPGILTGQGVEQEAEGALRLAPVLRRKTEENDVPAADLDTDEGGFPLQVLWTE
jgi:hypothetical protein